MNLEARTFITLLNEHLEDKNNGPAECARLLKSLNNSLSKEDINASVIDHYLIHFFDINFGFPNFITNSISHKSFKDCNKCILEIIYTLINNFPDKLEKYVLQIHDLSFKILKSSLVSSDEKVASLNVLILSFKNIDKCLEFPDHYAEIYKSLRSTFLIKKCDSVQEQILISLGTFAQKFQYMINNSEEELKKLFLSQLENQMVQQKEPSYKILNGAFTGLTCFCESFPFNINHQEDRVVLKKIYQYIDKLATPTSRIKIPNRAALTFLSNNIYSFILLMLEKYKNWHETLLSWLQLGDEDKKVGFKTLMSFYVGLGNALSDTQEQNMKEITLYFLEYFKRVMKNFNSSNYEIRSALHGFCSLSKVYQTHLTQEQKNEVFILVMQTFEQKYILHDSFNDDALEYLANFVQTVAKLMCFKQFSPSEIFCLQKGVINMIKVFPKLSHSAHFYVVEALVSTFHSLKTTDDTVFNRFLEDTVYQGVVWSCSRNHVSEAELSEDNPEKIITIRNYLVLWKNLLKITPDRRYDKIGIFLHDRKYIVNTLVSNFIKTLFILINKLNVNIVHHESETHLTDLQAIYKVAEVNDFAIFLNVVDFYEDIFDQIEPDALNKCIGKLIQYMISKCINYPYISGFYKLVAYCLRIANKSNYFDNLQSSQDKLLCYESLTQFVQTLLDKTRQFKDELLISCLQVLLRCPVILIRDILDLLVPVFITIFQVGKSYIKLTDTAIDTLEYWQNQIPSESFDLFLAQTLPILDSYLLSKSLGGVVQSNFENRRKTAQALKKRKVILEIEPELLKLQKKILNFIGRQNESVCQTFVAADSAIEVAVWGEQEHLKVILPYEDHKLELFLDKFVPRIVNLALNCSDRKTRIAACELLHAVVMVFLGNTKQMSHSGVSDLNRLFKNMAIALLKLGCDLDQIVQQLFEPLVFQLIHWYTHKTQIRGDHSAIVIDTIMEGITSPTDSALRDFSGKCVNEFIKWTIKQSSDRSLSKDPIIIKILVKKMRFFSMHPDPSKKLGAALIFNNIYRELREESALLSMFWFELLHIFIKSLATIEFETDNENCIMQIKNALTHIQRGFVEKSELFNRNDSDRRVPSDIHGDVLKDVSVWLLSMSKSQCSFCREKCMEMFIAITPLTKGFKSFDEFINKNIRNDCKWVDETYNSYLIKHPSLNYLPETETSNLLKWLQALLCALDGYIFVMKNKLLSSPINLNEAFINAFNYYNKNLLLSKIEDALALISTKKWIFTIFEKHQFNKLKTQIVVKVLQFLNTILSYPDGSNVLIKIGDCDLWNLLINVIFNPQDLGFPPLIAFKDDPLMLSLISNFLKKVPANKSAEVYKSIMDYINENNFKIIDLKRQLTLKERNVVSGLLVLQSCRVKDINLNFFYTGIVSALLNKILLPAENNKLLLTDLQDTTLKHCRALLEFALEDMSELQELINFLFYPVKVQTLDSNSDVNFGLYVLQLFEDPLIYKKLIEHFDIFVDICLRKPSLKEGIEFIAYLVNYVITQKDMRHKRDTICKIIMQKWHHFEQYFNTTYENMCFGVEFTKLILKISQSKHQDLKRWLTKSLMYQSDIIWERDLDFKLTIFRLLVLLIDTEEDNEDLSTALEFFKETYFGLSSPLSGETKVIALKKIFLCVANMQVSSLLKFVLEIYIEFTEILFELPKNLTTYIAKIKTESQEASLSLIYAMLKDSNYDQFQKYKLLKSAACVYEYCNLVVLESFCLNNIEQIISILQNKTNQDNLIDKIISFALLEIMFLRSPINNSDSEASAIALKAFGDRSNNKILLSKCLAFALNGCKDSPTVETKFQDLVRVYKCFCYKAMVSIITNSVKNPNLYVKLFVREENNSDILWKGLVDISKKYVFENDFDSIPKRRKVLVNIRDEVRARKIKENSQMPSVRYMESQRVYNSSLSEDLSKFDFSNTVLRSQDEEQKVENEDTSHIQSLIELDCVDVNNHECMATVCGLIDHIFKTKISELPGEEDENYVLPPWLEGIRKLLLSEDTHQNVKIFWIKVIDNMINIFAYFAKWFVRPLLKFIVDKCAGDSINYFVTDVMAILASWSTNFLPTDTEDLTLISKLVNFLIKNIDNERQDMFKYHLELFKLIVEAWKSNLEVPYDLLYSKLNIDVKSRKIEVGIHLASILLANKIAPWSPSNLKDFCMKLFEILRVNTGKVTYKPCAETIGLVLRFLRDKKDMITKIVGNVNIVLKKISDNEKYARTLEAIVLHYPEIVDEFHLTRLLSRIHAVMPSIRAVYLKIIICRSDFMENVSDFTSEKWENYIEGNDLEVQLLTLQVVHKCINILKEAPNFKNIIKSICKQVINSDVLIRSSMYDIAITICSDCCNNENKQDESFYLCRDILIHGLVDEDQEIREKVFKFWQNNASLPSFISSRFIYVFENLYKSSSESDFLGYTSYFLLDLTKKEEDFNEHLFEHPLEDCDFEEYNLQTNWRMRHASVVPMFAETLRSDSFDLDLASNSSFNQLRQTQSSLSFAPTQSSTMRQLSQLTTPETSLFIKSDNNDDFIDPNLVTISQLYKVPKRRFLRDKSKIQRFHANQEVKKSFRRVEQRKDRAKEHEHKVKIYRSYRKGDLPDVQITYQALIEPLQALCLRDAEISKLLCLSIFKCVISKSKSDATFISQISGAIKNILGTSTQYNRILIETLLDIVLLNKNLISLDARLVSDICKNSGLITMGTLLLEEYIIFYDDSPPSSKKARGGESDGEINYWLKLAELYREVEDWDVVKSIFLQKLDCHDNAKRALLAETEKRWQEAKTLYENLLQHEDATEKKDFYTESCFKCLQYMGKWHNSDKKSTDGILNLIDNIIGGNAWSKLWDQNTNQQKLLPWYIKAQTLKTLSEKNCNDFLCELNSLNSDNFEYLQNNFADELCMLWLYKEEIESVKQCVNLSINKFLGTWQSINPLYSNLRYNKLLKLRNIADINKFTTIYEHLHTNTQKDVTDLINYWDRTKHERFPSILLSELKVLARRQFINLLNKKLASFEDDDCEQFINALKASEFRLNIALVDTAIDQSNFYIAKNSMQLLRKSTDKQIALTFSRIAHLRCLTISNTPRDKFEIVMRASKSLGVLFGDGINSELKLAAHLELFNNMTLLPQYIADDSSLFGILKENVDFLEILDINELNSYNELPIYAAAKLKRCVLNFENEMSDRMNFQTESTSKEYQIISEAYIKLAYFAKDQPNSFTEFMFSVLRAMKHNSSEARQLFPCVLMEKAIRDADMKIFIEETANIPTWMFLGWIPQLLVNVDSRKIQAVAPILLKIAEMYPQAIMYAYRLSKENYKFEDGSIKSQAEKLIAQLDKFLANDPQIDVFLKALSFVSVPLTTLLYYERKILKMCLNEDDVDDIKLEIQRTIKQLFDGVPDSRNLNAMQGNMFKKIDKFKKKFQDISNKRLVDILKELKNMDTEIMNSLRSSGDKYSGLLKDYSPWLSNYSADKLNLELEIPGQYDGRKLPLPQHHIKISGFCPNVPVMKSMRKPIKLTILGNDTKEYPMLIKFGEDLRQDQRIQQLFSLMNNIFENDETFSARNLSILTFQVIPLNVNLGMIQWVDDTISLQEFMKKALKNTEPFRKAPDIYDTWISKSSRGKSTRDVYGTSAMKYTRDQTIPKFRSLVNMFPWDMLKTSFWSISANTQGFCALRENFIKSYAVLCVAHWILGIGDRHLENSLICLKHGKVLGIDFGHAFGTGTQILPVPELVPFRLTPQIINLMEPYGEKGVFREIMMHALRALRSNKNSLLATMNVFIEEPSLDWLEHASRFEGASDRRTHDWYPAQKIRQAQRKLEGASSTSIMIEDLQAGHCDVEEYMNAYIKLVRGVAEYDIRAKKPLEGLCIEDQVDCLIDHATDYNLLGRMYQGWMPWV